MSHLFYKLICNYKIFFQFEKELHKETCKLFADLAVVREEMATRRMNEQKRQRQQEIEEKEKAEAKKEWDKNFEVSFV